MPGLGAVLPSTARDLLSQAGSVRRIAIDDQDGHVLAVEDRRPVAVEPGAVTATRTTRVCLDTGEILDGSAAFVACLDTDQAPEQDEEPLPETVAQVVQQLVDGPVELHDLSTAKLPHPRPAATLRAGRGPSVRVPRLPSRCPRLRPGPSTALAGRLDGQPQPAGPLPSPPPRQARRVRRDQAPGRGLPLASPAQPPLVRPTTLGLLSPTVLLRREPLAPTQVAQRRARTSVSYGFAEPPAARQGRPRPPPPCRPGP